MLKSILSVFLSFLVISCNETDDVTPVVIRADSVKEVTVSGITVDFIVTCMIPTPCYDYYNYEETADGMHYFIKFIAKHDGQSICPQVISSLDAPYKVIVPKDGEYIFHFFQNDTTSLDTTIVIQ